jgi:hypothetical protein
VSAFPHVRAAELPALPEEQRWLVDGLWSEEAVGIVGGEPKSCKTFLALDLAVAVASGAPALRHFAVPRPGRVLLYAAEDSLHAVRERLVGICAAGGVAFDSLDLHLITAPALRVDLEADRARLEETVLALSPRFMVLDPFVRLHRVDENASGEIAPLLAWLRELQRTRKLAIAVVHHAKKGGGALRAGQALRGTSEFHAWGDSNLYLARRGEALTLAIEHRSAPSRTGLRLVLRDLPGPALDIDDRGSTPSPPEPSPASVEERVIAILAETASAMPIATVRERLALRNKTVSDALARLLVAGRVVRSDDGYRLSA